MPDIYFTDSGGARRAVTEGTPLPTGAGGGGGGGGAAAMSTFGAPAMATTEPRPGPVDLGPLLTGTPRVRDVAQRFNDLLLALEAAGYGTVAREE